jgi:hypothetical protein
MSVEANRKKDGKKTGDKNPKLPPAPPPPPPIKPPYCPLVADDGKPVEVTYHFKITFRKQEHVRSPHQTLHEITASCLQTYRDELKIAPLDADATSADVDAWLKVRTLLSVALGFADAQFTDQIIKSRLAR